MPLSTFSSESAFANHRAPDQPWVTVGLLAGLVALALLGAVECYWRAASARPSVTDSPALWAHHRGRASDGSHRTIVIVGASRGQLGIDVNELQRNCPGYNVVQLAIAGGSVPTATIADLAADDSFRGILLVDAAPFGITPENWSAQQSYVVAYHHPPSSVAEWETMMTAAMESRFVMLRSACGLRSLVASLLTGQNRQASGRWMSLDRFLRADFEQLDTQELQQLVLHEQRRLLRQYASSSRSTADNSNCQRSYQDWLGTIDRLAGLNQQMLNRGCRIVCVRFPTSGPRLPIDEQHSPRSQYWNVFCERLPDDVVTIHFEDEPTLRDFECPDMSHLDYRDARRFTAALAELLVERNVIVPQR